MLAEINWRPILIKALGALALLIAFIWLINYLFYGTVIITTNNPNNTITLTQQRSSKASGNPKVLSAHKKLSAHVRPGQYVVSVTGNSVATTQIVNAKARHTLKYNINPINATGIAPVTYMNPGSAAASANYVVYLDTDSGNVTKIDGANNITTVGQHYPIKTVAWASPEFGVGQDGQGNLYGIDVAANRTYPIKTPFPTDSNTSYAVSPSKQIYVDSGKDIYLGDQNGDFKKVYSSKDTGRVLSAGPAGAVVGYSPSEGGEQKTYTAIVDDTGSEGTSNFESDVAAWSPSGKYFAAASELGASILNQSLAVVGNVPSEEFVSNLAWLDDNTLLYSTNDQLWAYSVSTGSARILANMPLAQGVSDISVSSDGAYVYVISLAQDGSSALRRVGVKNQSVPAYMFQLQSIMPDELLTYSLDLAAFGQPPVILVKPHSGQAGNNYAGMASQELKSSGFDVSKFRFQVVQPNALAR